MKQLHSQGSDGLFDERLWQLSRHLDGSFMVLLAKGFAHLHETPHGAQMIQLVKGQVELLLALLRSHSERLMQCPYFLKNLKSVLKWWALLLHAHPLAFHQANLCTVLHTSVEVLHTCSGLKVSQELRPWLDGLLKNSILLLCHGFNSAAFRKGPQPAHQGATLEAVKACHSQFAEFVQSHSIGNLCEIACASGLRVPLEEVEEWLCDPEDQLLGPQSQTELHQAGESCIRSLGQEPLDKHLVEHIAKRMQEELARPPSVSDPYEAVAQKDTFLSVLALCQPQLKPHLQFSQMIAVFAPIAALVSQLKPESSAVLLPVRLCWVIRTWTPEITQDCLQPVLQLLQGFLSANSPKAVRLAALSPLRSMLDRFSDNEAWTQVQSSLIDSLWALLSVVKLPEVQWRCLNLIHLFLCEEAESGRYEVTERSLQQLLALWRQPEQGELLVRHALLDVLRALVLMSDRFRLPRLPLSPPLLSCCLAVISDCYSQHRGPAVAPSGPENSAALAADATAAAEALGDQASAVATLFDSGSVLFLGVLRTVELDQAAPLMGFFPQLLNQQLDLGGPPPEWTLDILLEYCALHCSAPGASAHLAQHYAALLKICKPRFQEPNKERTTDMCIQLLQLMIAHSPAQEALQQTVEIAAPLLKLWATTFDPWVAKSAFNFPLPPVLGMLGAWHARHPQHFMEQVNAQLPGGNGRVALLLAASCKHAKPVHLKAALVSACLTVAESCSLDESFWRELLQACNEVIVASSRTGPSSTLAQALQALKSSLSAKLPAPARSAAELQYSLVPLELRQGGVKEDGSLQETAVARWLFGCVAAWLRQLSAAGRIPDLQVLLSVATPQVREALAGSGL
eukprot:TRINITY_DN35496_c0_g1_i1.p1 TRINITY_DN35496_c0_g1~~TRINITY_DN35496_c0_g1_i1.p1  ORF type:complete len:854 (-),score=163.50 TRINITY_DN35496_c0_g1_i1:68-2629(-)